MFAFQSLNGKIDQNTNFAKLQSDKWLSFGITANLSFQILKSKHSVSELYHMIQEPKFTSLMGKMRAIEKLKKQFVQFK